MIKNILGNLIIASFILLPFSSLAAPSAITVYSASNITENSATLSGVAVLGTDNLKNTVYFRYSAQTTKPVFCKDIYGSNMVSTPDIDLGLGNGTSRAFSQDIANLTPDTKYYYCAIVSDKSSITYLNNTVSSFTTKPCADCNQTSILTESATNITKTAAKLNGFYNNANYVSGTVWFEYDQNPMTVAAGIGIKTSTSVMLAGSPPPGSNVSANVSQNATGLSQGKTYYYRAVAKLSTSDELITGNVVSFKTLGFASSLPCPAGTPISYWQNAFGNTIIQGPIPLNQLSTLIATPSDVQNPSLPIYANSQISNNQNPSPNNTATATELDFGNPNQNSPAMNPSSVATMLTMLSTPPVITPTSSNPCPPINSSGNSSNSGSGSIGSFPSGANGANISSFSDAIVRYHEGVEHVFARQIRNNPALARLYGYQVGMDLNLFANDTAHLLAQIFGYIDNKGKEIRVSPVDVAAYEIKIQADNSTIIKEYLGNILINTRKISYIFKSPKESYEYYYTTR